MMWLSTVEAYDGPIVTPPSFKYQPYVQGVKKMRPNRILPALMLSVLACTAAHAEGNARGDSAGCNAGAPKVSSQNNLQARACFESLADSALLAMKAKAATLKVGGVAVVAYFDGDRVESWSSRMLVVDRLKDEPSSTQKGSNLLGIAYAKAAEMADTLKNSGSQVRPPMTGEFGWEGGVITRTTNGYLIAAFSGGQSSDDVEISHAGVAQILDKLNMAK